MKMKEIIHALEMFAPLPLQESYDNAGLQIGLTDAKVTGALLCLDITEHIIDEAIAIGCNLIISHHPLMFKGYKSFTGADYVQRCVMKAIKHDLLIYSAHTNLDNTPHGVSYKMAELLGLKQVRTLSPQTNSLIKLATFVPYEAVEKVRQALFEAGCGHIGNYDCCSYNTEGVGTFRALENSQPYCGTINELHEEQEVKVETILPAYLQQRAERALLQSHPYEEPAYDFISLANEWKTVGSGVIGELDTAMKEVDFLQWIKQVFHVGAVKYSPLRGKEIQRVALCGGSGGLLLPQAQREGADIYITGEVKYHDYFFYQDKMLIADIGHYESEQYTMELLKEVLLTSCPTLQVYITEHNTNPINYL